MSYILEALRKVEQQRGDLPVQVLSSRRRYTIMVSPAIPKQRTLIIVSAAIAGGVLVSGILSVYLASHRKTIPIPAKEHVAVQPATAVSGLDKNSHNLSPHEDAAGSVASSEVNQTTKTETPLPVRESRHPVSASASGKMTRERQRVVSKTAPHLKRNAHARRQPIKDRDKRIKPLHSGEESRSHIKKADDSSAAGQSNNAEMPLLSASSPQLQGLPQIKIDGVIYSSEPGKSVVIINTRLYSEGQKTLDGITVEAIRQDGVICSYHGKRFRLTR